MPQLRGEGIANKLSLGQRCISLSLVQQIIAIQSFYARQCAGDWEHKGEHQLLVWNLALNRTKAVIQTPAQRTGEVAQWLSVHTAYAVDLNSVLSTHIRWLTAD